MAISDRDVAADGAAARLPARVAVPVAVGSRDGLVLPRALSAVPFDRAAPAPAPLEPVAIDAELVVEVLELLVGADGEAGIAAAGLPPLLQVEGVRGVAVVVRQGASAVVVGSAGYDCGVMAPGAALALDSGLPVTEAVRRRATVVQGTGPWWVAVPFACGRSRTGALLLSLDAPPPASPAELGRLERIARAVGEGLRRAAAAERAGSDLERLLGDLAAPALPPAQADVAARSVPYDGPVGGDVVLWLPDGRGGRWSLVADVCGSGLGAAVTARTVHATLAALGEQVAGPAALLAAADRALRPLVGPDSFVTAVAVRSAEGRIDVATAGHPPPLVLTPAGVRTVAPEPGPPLALGTGDTPVFAETSYEVPDDAVLLLHTDGLLDRRRADGPCPAEAESLVAGLPLDDVAALADGVLAAAEAVGVAGDDVSLLVARL